MSSPALPGRPVRESLSEYTQVMLPNDANTHGSVLGGHIMHLIDLCGAVAGVRHTRRTVATASVSCMSFLHPVRIGQLLTLKLDDDGMPLAAAPVLPETDDEKRRFEEAGRRREDRLRARERLTCPT